MSCEMVSHALVIPLWRPLKLKVNYHRSTYKYNKLSKRDPSSIKLMSPNHSSNNNHRTTTIRIINNTIVNILGRSFLQRLAKSMITAATNRWGTWISRPCHRDITTKKTKNNKLFKTGISEKPITKEVAFLKRILSPD